MPLTRNTLWMPLLALVLGGLICPGLATAKVKKPVAAKKDSESELIRSIRVIQQRPFLKRQRFELQILGGLAVTDTMFRHYSVNAHGRYHIDERWSVGVSYGHYFASESTLYTSITEDYEVFPERSLTRYFAGVDAAFAPVYGKMAFLDGAVLHFDLYVLMGLGVTQTSRSATPRVTGTFGVGGRLMLTKWLTAVMELRDHLFVEDFHAGNRVMNNVMFTVGVSIWFPFAPSYKFPK